MLTLKRLSDLLSSKNNLIEYVVIDGLSTDGTFQKIIKYKDRIDKIIRQKDTGIYDAMNKGIKYSKGVFIGFCNSGDLINKGGIKLLTDNLDNKTDVLFATVKRNYLGKTIIKVDTI